ncbi:MAG TPA: ATP-binding protein [Allosphingosinicella sp.]|jgi:signal transduction histidine kinase/ActR/RegA family two-component response regulator
MAGEDMYAMSEERTSGAWRGVLASAGAVLAALLLVALMLMVTSSNEVRDRALASERHSYDVMLLTRTVDGTIARAEAALGRYVLDEDVATSGSVYGAEWRQARQLIAELRRQVRGNREQLARVESLEKLFETRGRELAPAAVAAQAKRGSGGLALFYGAALSPTGQQLRNTLAQIATAEREDLRQRMSATRLSSSRSDQLTEWLGWAAVLIGLGAIVIGWLAFRAISERLAALREADSEASRARQLEEAVRERTRELSEAYEQLKAESAEREAAEAQLRQVQKMEAVGQLTGGIAHDFNNMLAVVVGGLDLARRKLTGRRREVEFHLDNAMEGATRAAALTRRLLAFARAEPLLPVAVAPAGLVEGMLDLVDRSIGERITVRTHFPDETWNVSVDTNQLENAILNLAVNARDAMEGEGQLGIHVENVALPAGQVGELAAGDYVRISVSDTGSGMSPEVLERVFEPFFTTKPVGKGTGLGLSQIFGFARESGGDVVIESAVGVGSTVSLYLPRSSQQVESAASPAPGLDEAALGEAGTAILVVEDDPRVSRSTVGALEELGYRPIACAGGREALEILEREAGRIELVITDIMMPEMTGPELVREATARWPSTAILYVTGYVGEAGSEELSGHDILRKPFTVAALAAAVAGALARRPNEWPPASAAAAGGR